MILNLKYAIQKRGVLFEELARLMLREKNKNNFIFRTKSSSLEEFGSKYRLDFSNISLSVMDFLKKYLNKVDLIEFVLEDTSSRIVKTFVFYEVKTKNHTNKSRLDICVSSYKTYSSLEKFGFDIKIVSFVIFEDWRCSFNVNNLNLSKFRLYSRYKDNDGKINN
jgi:hypothetical protein